MGDSGVSRGRSRIESLNRRWCPWRYRSYALVFVCFLLELFSTVLVGMGNNVIWVSNGLLLAYLLLAPRWRWSSYLAAGFAGQFLGSVFAWRQTWQINLALAALNLT